MVASPSVSPWKFLTSQVQESNSSKGSEEIVEGGFVCETYDPSSTYVFLPTLENDFKRLGKIRNSTFGLSKVDDTGISH